MSAHPRTSDDGPNRERELVRAASAGDRTAFAALYREHHRRVYAVALRMVKNAAVAEDVVQDAFVEAWTSLPSFRGDSRFGTWIHGVAVRTALHALRSERRRVRRSERYGAERYEDTLRAASPDTRIDVERAVAALPERARATLLLHMAGFDHAAIAEQLEVTVGTVKSQLHRARRLVLERIDR